MTRITNVLIAAMLVFLAISALISGFAPSSFKAGDPITISSGGSVAVSSFGETTLQPASVNGLAKAMVFTKASGEIVRCYNGITESKGKGCGFSSMQIFPGLYLLTFPFSTLDHFFTATSPSGCTVAVDNIGGGQLQVSTREAFGEHTFVKCAMSLIVF